MASILLVDDHSLIRSGIKMSLEVSDTDHEIQEAGQREEALERLKERHFDIVVLDLSLANDDGADLASEILQIYPDMKILILTMHDDDEHISKCVNLGVHGYLLKTEGSKVKDAIQDILKGQQYYSEYVKEVIVNQYTQDIKTKQAKAQLPKLTEREKEIITEVKNGLTSNQIAEKLFISVRTVDKHRGNVMHKLGVSNAVELINKIGTLKLLDN
ncbi:MAG: response regulator transcription factor [Cyclobacteriaceae bacterium]|nr:response regulator transcription factor [Cyclobacteriaceae bacterium]